VHGVGVSVTNALDAPGRDGLARRQDRQLGFADGDVVKPLATQAAGRGEKKSGTRVQVWPNPKYFDSPNLPLGELQRLLRSKAVLLPGVEVVLVNEKTGERQAWNEDGLRGYLLDEMNGSELLIPLFEGERFADARSTDDTFAEGEGASWVVAWTEEGSPCANRTST
jgi:topoisomerase-4 subunit B